MVLVDTSVWVNHLREGDGDLQAMLLADTVLGHPSVIGELACGNLRNRAEILDLLRALPPATVATDDEVLAFIEAHRVMGRGVGWVDAHLLAAATLSGARLWTRDSRLRQVAASLGLAHGTPAAHGTTPTTG